MFEALREILVNKEKKFFIIIALMMVVGGLLEVISLGILIPFITFLVNPEVVTTNSYIIKYFPYILSLKQSSLLYFSLCIVFFIFLMKSLYMLWFYYKKNKFIYEISNRITIKIFSFYMVRPYSFHLENNSSNFIANCINEVKVFIYGVLLGGLELVSEIVIIFFIATLLFVVNPAVSIIAITIALILFLIFQGFTKSKLKKWGTVRQTKEEQIIEKVQQGYNGIKEIIVFLKERYFIESYSKATTSLSAVNIKLQTLMDIPKIILEFIAIIIFIIMTYLILKFNSSVEYFFPVIALYAGASFKLLPALNRVIVSMQKLSRSSSAIFRIRDQLKNYNKYQEKIDKILVQDKITPLRFEKKISLKNVFFKYPAQNNYVLENINLNIKKGEIVGIIGKSGEGKSTLINIICGFIIPTSGSIFVDDISIQENLREWRATFGYIPQTTYLFNDTISNNIIFYSNNLDNYEKKLEESIKISELESLVEDLPLKKETIVGERAILLSGGQAQRIALARTIYKDPQVLILDEATSSLDYENEKKNINVNKVI